MLDSCSRPQVVEIAGRVHTFDGNISDIKGLFGDPPELEAVFRLMDKQAAEVSTLAPHLHPEARQWDAVSVDEWLRANAREPATRSLVSWLFKVCSGMETSQMSHLFWLYFIRQSGGTRLSWIGQGRGEKRRGRGRGRGGKEERKRAGTGGKEEGTGGKEEGTRAGTGGKEERTRAGTGG